MKTLAPVRVAATEEVKEVPMQAEHPGNAGETLERQESHEDHKITLEDAYVFVQCESDAYLIEKALGNGEKMLVRDGSIVGVSKSVYVQYEKDTQYSRMVSLTGPGSFYCAKGE